MVVLALECSTSAAKALVYDTKSGRQQLCSEDLSGAAAGTEQDAEAVFSALLRNGRAAAEASGLSCEAVALVSTWHSLLLCGSDGEPRGGIRLWSDLEAAEYTARAARDPEFRRRVYERTGCVLHATYPVWKYRYLLENGRVPPGLQIYSEGEYLFRRMTGERAVPLNVASGTGWLNLAARCWDDEMLRVSGAEKRQFGPLCGEGFSRPLNARAARALGVRQGIPVYAGGADGAMTQFGCGAFGEGVMTLSVGTSGALRLTSREPMLSESMSTWCYCLTENSYLAGAATNGAGNCVNRYTRRYGKSAKEFDALLEGGDFSRAPVFLPFLFGERGPGYAEKPHGGFFPEPRDPAAGYYAVLEGVLFNLYQCYEELARAGGVPEEIRVSGGIVNSPLWLQMCADIFGREIQAAPMQHASLFGGVVAAALKNGEDMRGGLWSGGRTVAPRAEKIPYYRERYRNYLAQYHREKAER